MPCIVWVVKQVCRLAGQNSADHNGPIEKMSMSATKGPIDILLTISQHWIAARLKLGFRSARQPS